MSEKATKSVAEVEWFISRISYVELIQYLSATYFLSILLLPTTKVKYINTAKGSLSKAQVFFQSVQTKSDCKLKSTSFRRLTKLNVSSSLK